MIIFIISYLKTVSTYSLFDKEGTRTVPIEGKNRLRNPNTKLVWNVMNSRGSSSI